MYLTKRLRCVLQLCAEKCSHISTGNCYNRSYSQSQTYSKEKWDLLSGVCVERKRVISKQMTQLEDKFTQLLERIEFERSLKSDHEVRRELDERQAELLKKGEVPEADEQKSTQTAQDFEDLCQEELVNFKFAPRECGDEADVRSVERRLDSSVLLLVKQRLADEYVWALPHGARSEGEAMHQAAARVLQQSCGANLNVRFFGFAPCGFYKYLYPRKVRLERSGTVGAKIFFYKAEFLSGCVECNGESVKDFKWLGQDELAAELHKDYYRSVSAFLIDEN
ncbi:large ribosomal subunit protein mL46 [Bacillus rossius redtenbacheri]|uniref:large ribosomal subunit protein mL46 n=1 Tax=Bacillus rossius redtenbacheri TaxID=93214 RepID=UPI002FDD7AC3